MVVGHVTDPEGLAIIRKYLRWQHRTHHAEGSCPDHGQAIIVSDEGERIVFRSCCQKAVGERLEQICKVVDWLDFYDSINTPE